MRRRRTIGTGERRDVLRLPRFGPSARVWILNVVLAAIAWALVAGVVSRFAPVTAPFRVPWWALAATFAVTESFVVHLQVRREAHSFSLSDVPLVFGLFFVEPVGLVAAQVLGAAVALAVRRQAPMKYAFNIAHFALTAALAVIVFQAVGGSDPLGTAGLIGAFLAAITTTLTGAVAITIAVSLAEGRAQPAILRQGLGFGTVVALTDTCIALLGAKIVWHDPSVVWLLAIPAALLFLAYRLYTGQRQRHGTLEVLYEAARRFQGSLRMEETTEMLLSEARQMFRAECAVMTIFPSGKGERAVRTVLGPGEGPPTSEPVDLDPREGVWARVAAEGQPVLLARPIPNPRIREHFAGRGIRDAMVAPLVADGAVIGTMLVGNRMGDVSTFDEDDLRLFETLTSQASVALQNARLVTRLEESLAHLTEMNRLKDDFVATVSHELRTPLTNIQGAVKTLLRLDLAEKDRRELLEAADRGSERLRQLIEDLLMASRIESREVRIVVHRVQVPELLHAVARDVNLEGSGHRLELRLAAALPTVETDEGKLSQILTNLVDNARKYSDDGSTVVVEAGPVEDGVQISVTNRGEPIPEEQQSRIFDRFFQVDQTSTRPHGGAGLGLYICRKLADAVGGRVWLHRSDETGTEFRLFVPSTPPRGALREEYEPVPPLS